VQFGHAVLDKLHGSFVAHVQKVGHVLAGCAFVYQLPRMVDLLGCEFGLPTKLYAPALRGLHSTAGKGR